MATQKMCKAACKVMTIQDRAFVMRDGVTVDVWVCRCCDAETPVRARKPSAKKVEQRDHIKSLLRAAGL